MKPRKPEKIGEKFKLTRINPSERTKMPQTRSSEVPFVGSGPLPRSKTGTSVSGPSGLGQNDTGSASGRDEIDQLEKRLRANQSTRPNRGQRITNLISMFEDEEKLTEKVIVIKTVVPSENT